MSRAKKPHGRPPAIGTIVASSEDSATTTVPRIAVTPSILPRRPWALRLAAIAFLGWTVALVAMTLLTANPSTVSREQVQHSDAVVLGRLVAAERDEIRIERVLQGDLAVEEAVKVLNLPEVTEIAADQSYLFPLTRFRQDYVVTTLKGQHASPLIYPAAPETIKTAVEFLREARN